MLLTRCSCVGTCRGVDVQWSPSGCHCHECVTACWGIWHQAGGVHMISPRKPVSCAVHGSHSCMLRSRGCQAVVLVCHSRFVLLVCHSDRYGCCVGCVLLQVLASRATAWRPCSGSMCRAQRTRCVNPAHGAGPGWASAYAASR